MKTALIGLGLVAERIHLPALALVPELTVAAAAEVDPDRRARIGAAFRIPKLYAGAAEMLAAERPELVIVGTPPQFHHALCREALAAGAHVLCEKPFVTEPAEGEDLIAAASAAGRVIAVNNQYRHMRIYAETRRRLTAGEFGPAYYIHCWQTMDHPPTADKTAWRTQMKRAVLYEFGTHPIDLICSFFDALPETVSALMPRPRAGVEADVLDLVTLKFPGERAATLALNRVSKAPYRYLEMRMECAEASVRMSLGGVARFGVGWAAEAGRPTLKCSFVRGGEARVERRGVSRKIAVEPTEAFASATAAHLREMIADIRAGRTDNAGARRSLGVLRVALAGYDSAARGGEPVRLVP
jgi:predicted dehydrogenase